MQLRYNFRLYPTASQREALARAFGCARTVYNDGLRMRQEAREAGLPYIKDADLQRQVLTEAKHNPDRAWLAEVSYVVLGQAVNDLNGAYRRFFASLQGRSKQRNVGPPRFKSRKTGRQTIRFTRNAFRLRPDGHLNLAKVGDVPVRWSRRLPSTPSSVTVIKDGAGRYFASFVVRTDPAEVLPEVSGEVGIDLGLTHFAVLSDGRKVSSPKFFRRAERRIRKAQQALSRKEKGSNNRQKAVQRVARLHARVTDARRDHHHKLSTQIIRENQAVYVENLSVKGLARTRLAKSIHDAGWSTFVTMLEYKATRYGRTFAKVDRWLPSSQTCHVCMVIDGPKPLNVRTWICGACNTEHDRDVNAARVILAVGRAERQNACRGTVRPAAQRKAGPGETGTQLVSVEQPLPQVGRQKTSELPA
ncbi:RNA-guided endonuclease InsQ/TnpB family protein [Streptomyces tendae]|uniref:RNA-guided endonuclease InsQ/TnpB family protein n=1 Tax=Streptomyces tendae TaxID=1932 RepID=UPI003D73F6E9